MVENNTWIEANDSSTVIVFVHGILSSSEACWRNTKTDAFWPELILNDPNFLKPSVFVAGYSSDLFSGEFEVRDSAEEIIIRLRDRANGHPAVLDKPKILFVCHSQGGIVVRQLLVSHHDQFLRKKVGVVLCASPGWGSKWANYLTPAAKLIGFQQAVGLGWGSSGLLSLDRDFLDLIEKRRIAHLCGMSLVETRGVFGLPKFVTTPSSTRYFTKWLKIPKANHGEVVKPPNLNHLSHVALRDFAKAHGFILAKSACFGSKRATLPSTHRLDALRELAFEDVGRRQFIRRFSRGPHVPIEQVDSTLIREAADVFPTPIGNFWPDSLQLAANYRSDALESDEGSENAVLTPARIPKNVTDASLWHSTFQTSCLIGPRMLASLCLAILHEGYNQLSLQSQDALMRLIAWLEENRNHEKLES